MSHAPIESNPCAPLDGACADCSCGHRDVVWSTPIGARQAYLEHVVAAARDDAGWPGTVFVDYDENES